MTEFRLREMRQRAGMTQQELAELIGSDHQQVGKWERGEVRPTFHRATDIAVALGCSLDELAGIEAPPTDLNSNP